jgi:DNA-binding CsgD family transcriptional regulator
MLQASTPPAIDLLSEFLFPVVNTPAGVVEFGDVSMTGVRRSFDWAGHAAAMIGSLGSEALPLRALSALSDLVDFEHTGIFLFRSRQRPRDLLARQTGRAFHRTYCEETFLLDPFYIGAQRCPAGVFRMPDLDASYRRYLDRYEMGPRLTDVLPHRTASTAGSSGHLAEEIGFLLPVGAGRVVHIALIRSTAMSCFGEDEVSSLRSLAPVLQAAFESHFRWRPGVDHPESDADRETAGAPPDPVVGRLTPREIEIVEMILNGLTTVQIAARLSIAAGTVKVHRKNIYRKLSVGSREELMLLSRRRAGRSDSINGRRS